MRNHLPFEIAVVRVGVTAPRCTTHLRRAIGAALLRHRTPAARISVALVDDAHIARLNTLYLRRKGPTDVLSFDLRDDTDDTQSPDRPGAVKPASRRGGGRVEGEIVVSVDAARREAAARGHSVVAELTLYAVHGVLHLLGYRDRRKSDAIRMHRMEDDILSDIGLGALFGASPKRR